jgi:2-succinyl-6-hydroxy-2,4-cyclohexadiene-1-carboxylate synthase
MRPLVLLHGMLGAPSSFDALRASLGDRAVIAPWLPGHGPDPRPVPSSFTACVDALAETLAPHAPFDLLGYSLGARVALGLLARHRLLIGRALLVSVHPGLASGPARAARSEEDERWARRAEDGIAALADAWETRPLFATQRSLPAQAIAVQRAARIGHTPAGIAAAFRVLGLGAMPEMASTIVVERARVGLVVGALDEKFANLAGAFAAVVPIDRIACGHNPLVEAPARLAAIATRFFTASATPQPMEHSP